MACDGTAEKYAPRLRVSSRVTTGAVEVAPSTRLRPMVCESSRRNYEATLPLQTKPQQRGYAENEHCAGAAK